MALLLWRMRDTLKQWAGIVKARFVTDPRRRHSGSQVGRVFQHGLTEKLVAKGSWMVAFVTESDPYRYNYAGAIVDGQHNGFVITRGQAVDSCYAARRFAEPIARQGAFGIQIIHSGFSCCPLNDAVEVG